MTTIIPVETIRKWCDLTQRRCAYYVDLHDSGRWRRFYSEEQFHREMGRAVWDAESWAKVLDAVKQ